MLNDNREFFVFFFIIKQFSRQFHLTHCDYSIFNACEIYSDKSKMASYERSVGV